MTPEEQDSTSVYALCRRWVQNYPLVTAAAPPSSTPPTTVRPAPQLPLCSCTCSTLQSICSPLIRTRVPNTDQILQPQLVWLGKACYCQFRGLGSSIGDPVCKARPEGRHPEP